MISPFTALNSAAIRAEARASRQRLAALAAAICLAAAVLLLAHMALQVAVNLDTIAARAIATRGM
jgi:hypothetical protein